jgi:hypothetical protein
MLDRDDRAQAAEALRELASEIGARSHSDATIARQDRLGALADALAAEPAGYDYETAATERGEALRGLLDALQMTDGPQSPAGVHSIINTRELRSAIARAEEVMEGVEPSGQPTEDETRSRDALDDLAARLADAIEPGADIRRHVDRECGLLDAGTRAVLVTRVARIHATREETRTALAERTDVVETLRAIAGTLGAVSDRLEADTALIRMTAERDHFRLAGLTETRA